MNILNHPHPGVILREDVIVPLGLTVSDAAEKLGMSRTAFSRVINGKAGISPIWQSDWKQRALAPPASGSPYKLNTILKKPSSISNQKLPV
ncbi:virulence-associated protein [Advenella kashmirensis WT001]|uniref:Virulence-associated protein n=1 Tax=Advenella kashmirensis (strain DSM 17095 / LMG 22695 / WT001) TaxID=1036672 RepID=I3U8R9_ADVKW|nr:virulence-associated protein [Advenella kashmirensis WT001]